ncbi:MAG: hypothetical protein ACK4WD_08435 [Flavobacteriales bacterium]|jgi:glycosyltransferase involved in cell wall biosynthesis
MSNSIALVFFEGYLSVSPTLINIAESLSEKGCKVEIFTRTIHSGFPPYAPSNSNIHVTYLSSKLTFFERIKNRVLSKKSNHHQSLLPVEKEVLRFEDFCIKRIKKSRFDAVIAVDAIGASICSKTAISNKIYLSLEISFFENYKKTSFSEKIKEQEILFHKTCKFSIIQDQQRWQLLCKENGLDWKKERVYFLPNAPRGVAKIRSNNEFFLHKKFELPSETFIVLSAGMISAATHSLELLQQAKKSEKYILIFHSRNSDDAKTPYFRLLEQEKAPNIRFSLDPVKYEDLEPLLNSAHIGVAIYNNAYGDNFSNILFASGKLSQYLKLGIPIIVNDLPGMSAFIEKTKCGQIVTNLEDFNAAVERIRSDYKTYSHAAKAAFDEYFSFDRHFQLIGQEIVRM